MRTKTSSSVLLNEFQSKILTDKSYKQHLIKFLLTKDDNFFYQNLDRILTDHRIDQVLNVFSYKIENIGINPICAQLSYSRIIAILKNLINKHKDKINNFISIRDNYEKNLLIGNYEIAEELLNNYYNSHGDSIWYIKNKILLLSYMKKSQDLQNFCDQYKNKSTPMVNNLINNFQVIFDTDNSILHLKELVISNISEMQRGGEKRFSNFLGLLFVPDPLIGKYNNKEALPAIQSFNIIDQYVLLCDIFFKVNGDEIFLYLKEKFFEKNINIIKDIKIENFILSNYKKSLWEGVDLYNNGSYNDVIEQYIHNLENIENPLTYVNLIAKACLYSNFTFPKNYGVISELIIILKDIYQMNGSQQQLKEKLTSICIKLHGFSQSIQLQMVVYKAFYNNSIEADISLCAKRAIVAHPNVTNLTTEISKVDNISLKRFKNLATQEMPEYRKLKFYIIDQLDVTLMHKDQLDKLFETLKSSGIIKRDYIELYIEYLVLQDRIDDVLDFSVKCLIENQESYSCIPMYKIISKIEIDSISTLNAVIFCKFYTKLISSEKNYVLNETFEDFLYNINHTKPSDYLKTIEQLNTEEIIFFREICIPEIMDFLSCFSDLNELRNERLLILDLLHEKDCITYKYRITEVEKIINQIIVDDGTNHFNGAKICVDDASILEKNLDKLLVLNHLYLETDSDDIDDRLVIFSQNDDSANLIDGYVSGSKNSILWKMIKLISRAFVLDEEHGLDKNLSTEIRHGFFGNFMRAELEEKHLLSEINENGTYKKNVYWQQTCSMLNMSIWNEINQCIIEFTKKTNSLIGEAENWMRINKGIEIEKNIFLPVYKIYTCDFERVKSIADSTKDHVAIGKEIMAIMWEKTEESLFSMRNKLGEQFQKQFDQLFEELIASIMQVKKTAVLKDLVEAIFAAKGKVKEDIATVITWFQRGEIQYTSPMACDKVIEVAINLYSQIKKNTSLNLKHIDANLHGVTIEGNRVKPFVLALINILDNCYRHSGLGLFTQVKVYASFIDNNVIIKIENDVTDEKLLTLTDELILEINESLNNINSLDFMRNEGGTGIRKAHNHIASIGNISSLKVSRIEKNFQVEVKYAI